MKSQKILIILVTLILTLCPACSTTADHLQVSEPPEPSASTAAQFKSQYYQDGAFSLPVAPATLTPEVCDGFAALDWAESYDRLFEDDLAQYVAQYGVTYAGFVGTAHYFFRDRALWQGQIIFYELPDKSDIDIYIELRSYLLEIYGEPMPTSDASGLVSLEEAMLTGKGFCGASWSVQNSQGGKVQIALLFDAEKVQTVGSGRTSVTFTTQV